MKNKFYPFVTLEQIDAYKPSHPETRTVSPLVNAFLDALAVCRPNMGKNVAAYMDVDYRDLNGALRLETGMGFAELHERWVLHEMDRLKVEEPKLVGDALAQRLGLSDRSTLWRMVERARGHKSARAKRERRLAELERILNLK